MDRRAYHVMQSRRALDRRVTREIMGEEDFLFYTMTGLLSARRPLLAEGAVAKYTARVLAEAEE